MSATVTIQHAWPDGQTTCVVVEVCTSYPNALDQARATAVKALAEVMAEFEDEA